MDEDDKKDINHQENEAKLNRLFKMYAPYITKHIRRLKNSGKIPHSIDDEDLRYAGFHGLMDAIHKSDAEPESFKAYASHRVSGMILDAAREKSKIPRHHAQQAKNLKLLEQQKQQQEQQAKVETPEIPDVTPNKPEMPEE